MTIPKSTAWARANKDRVKTQNDRVKRTLNGKLANLISTSRYRAKLSKREHSVCVDDLRKIYYDQDGKCAISGKEMSIRGKGCAANSPYSISLDRIDSTLGYTIDNVWLVCTGVNLMKSRLTMEQFIDFCNSVSEKFS